jgi:ATP-dependent DNA helicase RecG
MARRKFRNNQRPEPSTRSFQEYILNQPAPQTSRTELIRLIRGGEDTYLELKVKLSNPERIAQGIVALANTAGGIIVFGVTDQLRVEGVDYPETVQSELVRICREDIYPPLIPYIDIVAFDTGRRVVVLEVEGKRRPYRTHDGRFYIRIGSEKREISRTELSGFLDEIRPLNYENIPLTGATERDIDDALLWSFARAFEEENELKFTYDTREFLRRDLLLAAGNSDEFVPTVAGILLFGNNRSVDAFLPRAKITATRYAGDSNREAVIEAIELKGNLLALYESALRFVTRYCDLSDSRPRSTPAASMGPARQRSRYQADAVREALANSLTHRDLALRDVPSRISIYDSSIEISNPRRTNGFAPPASRAIRYGITQRLNPQIAAIFSSPAYDTGHARSSLPQMLHKSRLFSGRRTDIYTAGDEFKVKFYGS